MIELLTVSRPEVEVEPGDRVASIADPPLQLFDVPVPENLRRFGVHVRASAFGDSDLPPVLVMGGISADCFPSLRPDGSLGWWSGLVGVGRMIDPTRFRIIGVDFAADESGASAPSTLDQAQIVAAAFATIGLPQPAAIIGASYGAMIGLALAAAEPERVDRLVVISAAASPHPASTAARELQRRVVELGMKAGAGDEGLAIARGMAMLTYRSPEEFEERFVGGIESSDPLCCSAPGAYLRSRGAAFRAVMSPGRFLSLSASIDRHHVRPSEVTQPCLIIGAHSDQIVPSSDLVALARNIAGKTELHLLDCLYGHDMFLKEAERIGKIIEPFVVRQ